MPVSKDRKTIFKNGVNLSDNQPLPSNFNCDSDEMVQMKKNKANEDNLKQIAIYKKYNTTNQGKKFVDICYPKIMAGLPYSTKELATNLCACIGYEGSDDPNYISTLQSVFINAPRLNMVSKMLDTNYQLKFGLALSMTCPASVGSN